MTNWLYEMWPPINWLIEKSINLGKQLLGFLLIGTFGTFI
jgi:hypothetical protein